MRLSWKGILISSIVLFIGLSVLYDNYYTYKIISGTYLYNFKSAPPDGPGIGDRLTLFEDGSFESNSWGKGIYKITGASIDLTYKYEFGNAGFRSTISRRFFWGKPRITVVRDLGYYFEKILPSKTP